MFELEFERIFHRISVRFVDVQSIEKGFGSTIVVVLKSPVVVEYTEEKDGKWEISVDFTSGIVVMVTKKKNM